MGRNYLSIHKTPMMQPLKVWDKINDFLPHFDGYVITDPCWDWS